jgi:hypothetical protein
VAGLACLRFPALTWLPGRSVARDESFSWLAKYWCGAGLISASHACATASPNPGIDFSSSCSRWYGAARTAILASATAASSSAIRSGCSRRGPAWCPVSRPVSAPGQAG